MADENPDPPAPETPQAIPQDPPPAATVVSEGTRTEREIELEAELQAERTARADAEQALTSESAARKSREVRVSELEDENHQLKEALKPDTSAQPRAGWGFYR